MPNGIGLGLGLGLSRRGASPAAGFDAATLALIEAIDTPPNITRQVLMNNLIAGLRADGVFDLLLGMWWVNDTEQASTLNWIDPDAFSLADVGSGPTFLADRHWVGNGIDQALSTQITPSTDGGSLYTQDSASMHVWCRNNVAENAADIGVAVTHNAFIRARSAGDAISGTINNAATSTAVIATSVGLTSMTRPNSTTQRIYKNGVQQGSDLAVNSTGLPAGPIRLCGRGTDLFSTKQICGGTVGASLSSAQVLALYNRVNTYLQAIGAA